LDGQFALLAEAFSLSIALDNEIENQEKLF
jgi:hypothetical protein